ncbi:MAG TPA: hypothetical protein VK158_06950 [Acidobacteriota bacterium]|nr:hypothetical protein [Acidobacteriota bacterium]
MDDDSWIIDSYDLKLRLLFHQAIAQNHGLQTSDFFYKLVENYVSALENYKDGKKIGFLSFEKSMVHFLDFPFYNALKEPYLDKEPFRDMIIVEDDGEDEKPIVVTARLRDISRLEQALEPVPYIQTSSQLLATSFQFHERCWVEEVVRDVNLCAYDSREKRAEIIQFRFDKDYGVDEWRYNS